MIFCLEKIFYSKKKACQIIFKIFDFRIAKKFAMFRILT